MPSLGRFPNHAFFMTAPRQSQRSARGLPHRSSRGFSLTEIMVVVTIISLLAAISLPTLKNVRRRTTATQIGNNLRTFSAAFETYVHEMGTWPAETVAGVLPPEVANRINPTAWRAMTPLGGQYNWDNTQMHDGTRFKAAIAISNTAAAPFVMDLDLIESIDRIIDDGNLATGNFRIGADDEPVYIISP